MERDRHEDVDDYERLDADLSESDPADIEDETQVPRRNRLDYIEREIEPESSADDFEMVHGDSGLEPNLDDERDVHDGDL